MKNLNLYLKKILLLSVFIFSFSSIAYAVELANEQFNSYTYTDRENSGVYWISNHGGSIFHGQRDWGEIEYNFGSSYVDQTLDVAMNWCTSNNWEDYEDYLRVRVNGTTVETDYFEGECHTINFTADTDSSGDFTITIDPRTDNSNESAYINWLTVNTITPPPPRVCNGTDGLLGEYYNTNNFTGSIVLSRVDDEIDFDWGNGSPGTGVNSNNFSVRWTGTIYIPEDGEYTFWIKHDDDIKITIDGSDVYNRTYRDWTSWFDASPVSYTAGNYPITIELKEYGGGAIAQIEWENDASISSRTIVPSTNLCTTPPTTTSADLALSETVAPSPTSANTGEDIVFSTHFENLGPDEASANITLDLTYSLDVTVVSVPTGLSCTVGSGTLSAGSHNICTYGAAVPSGTTADLGFTVQAEAGGSLTQTTTVSSATFDPVTSNNSLSSTAVPITLVVLLHAADNDYTVNTGGTLSGNVITDNDPTHGTDTGNGTLTVTANSSPAEGTLTLNSDGSFTYDASSITSSSTQTFTYTITSSTTGGTSQATVTIEVVINTDYDTTLEFTQINPSSTQNVIGDYLIAGNTVLCLTGETSGYPDGTDDYACQDTTSINGSNTASTSNNYVAKYIDIDNDSSTWNSSSSNITLPAHYDQLGGNGILWAGLIWQGRFAWNSGVEQIHYYTENGSTPLEHETGDKADGTSTGISNVSLTDANVKNIRFKIGTGAYNQITAHKVYSKSSSNGRTYSALADVTSLLRNANLASGIHTFTVANLPTSEGREHNPGIYGGWSLTVIYAEDPFVGKPRNITIFGGMLEMSGSTTGFTISGFKLPSSGNTVTAQLSIFSGEGEEDYGPDGVRIGLDSSDVVAIPEGTTDDTFNAVMSDIDRDDITGESNNLQNNNTGLDVDNFDISSIVSDFDRNTTSFYIEMWAQEYVIPGMVAFSTELYKPSLCYDYTLDIDGYAIPSSDNVISTNLGGYTSKPLTTRVSIRSEEGDFTLRDVNITYAIADTNQTYYHTGTTAIAPNGVYRYIPVPAGQVYNETTKGFGLYIGEGAAPGQGGYIDSYQTRYFKFDNDMNRSSIDTTFSLAVQYTVDFGSGPVPQGDILDAEDICQDSFGYYPTTGRYNVASVDADPATGTTDIHGAPYNLYSQVAGRDFRVEVYSYDPDHLSYKKDANTTIEVEIFNAGMFNRDTNLTCNNPDSNVTEPVFVEFHNETWTTVSGNYNVAMRNVGFRTWHLTAPDGGPADHHCADKDDETCFRLLYTEIYGDESNCTTRDNAGAIDGGPCDASGSGCYECLRTYYGNPICSRDNFAIRPDAFVTKLLDSNQSTDTTYTPTPVELALSKPGQDSASLSAGYGYRYDINATSYTSDQAVPKYIRIFNGDDASTSTSIMNWAPTRTTSGCNDTESKPVDTVLFDGTNIYGTTAVGRSVDQIGEYQFVLSDQNWTSVDWEDALMAHHVTPGFNTDTSDDCIYDSNLTESDVSDGRQGCEIASIHTHPTKGEYTALDLRFYPYDFSLNLNLGAGPTLDRSFAYINTMLTPTSAYPNSIDRNMSYNIQGTFTALGFGGIAVNNFVENCYADAVDMTLMHTYLGSTLPSNETALRYNLVDHNTTDPSNEIRVRENGVLTALSTSETALIIEQGPEFFRQDMQGSITMDLGFNFNRTNNNVPALNPRRVHFGDFNITDKLGTNISVDMKSDHIIKGDLASPNDTNVTFMYARAKPAKEFYDDVTADSIATPISVVVYCEQNLTGCINLGLPWDGASDIQTNEIKWYKAIYHDNVTKKDGNIGITQSTAAALSTNVVPINVMGENNLLTVIRNGAARPITVPIELITPPTANYTDRWLIYNPSSATAAPSPFYRVRFIGQTGWAGHGKTGHVVDGNTSNIKNRRLGW